MLYYEAMQRTASTVQISKKNMKAAYYDRYGDASVISVRSDIARPVPTKNQILVKVYASTVNRTDTGYRSASYFISRFFTGLFRPKRKVLGTEFAGEVIAVGSAVDAFELGDRVYGFDEKNFGGNAEYKVIEVDGMIAHIPANLEYSQAAAIAEGAHYALGYIRSAGITARSRVFVNGATGAIGSAAVQIIADIGASVVVSCRAEHTPIFTKLGVAICVDYRTDFSGQLSESFDVYFDSVGKSSFKAAKRILDKKGIYMSTEFGEFPYNPVLAFLTRFSKRRVLFPLPRNSQKDLHHLNRLIEHGAFTPLIDKEYSLDDIVEATEYTQSGQKVGNVVIRIR